MKASEMIVREFFKKSKKDMKQAKKDGDQETVDDILDTAEAIVDEMIEEMPPDLRRDRRL